VAIKWRNPKYITGEGKCVEVEKQFVEEILVSC
jgi:hypothetical protein